MNLDAEKGLLYEKIGVHEKEKVALIQGGQSAEVVDPNWKPVRWSVVRDRIAVEQKEY